MALGSLPFNPFARSANNRVVSEQKNVSTLRVFTTLEGPFHAGTVEIGQLVGGVMTVLKYGTDFEYGFIWSNASNKLGTKVFATIVISEAKRLLGGVLYVNYNAVGGSMFSGFNYSAYNTALSTKTSAQAMLLTAESQYDMPSFPTVANIWGDTTLTDLAAAKASLSTLGLEIQVKARSM